MTIVFDKTPSNNAKAMLAKLRLVSELAAGRRELLALPAGVKGLARRLALVKRANEIRVELGVQPTAAEPVAAATEPQPEAESRRSTAGLYQFHEKRTRGQRQKANNAAITLLNAFMSSERDRDSITDDERAVLAGYTGNGGALIGADGKKGSAYEYYTPKPIAEGVWSALEEMGFAGGKVLDPCAGVGIFGATAPASAVVDAVELDETSGNINALVNNGPGYNTTVSPFEAVAANTPDEMYDAVVSNVPFGTTADRGGNQLLDGKYQKDTLESYFILRSLDKLKPGGLAAFIVPPRCVSGKGGAEAKLRARASLKAEFLGAYRLPNSVFGAADADTITDVIFFRKFSADAADKIAELKEQDPALLESAKVLWQPFLEGKYFTGEGKRFVLGEFVPKDPDKFRDVDRVKNPASIPDVAKLLRKLPDSRIDWEALDAAETEVIRYQDGDTLTQDGQTLQLQNGQWVVLQSGNQDAAGAELLGKAATPYTAHENGLTLQQAELLMAWLHETSRHSDTPAWLASAMSELSRVTDAKRGNAWECGLVGMAVAQVLDEAGRGSGTNFHDEYPGLSLAMKGVAPQLRKLPALGGELKRGIGELKAHYRRKTGFSAVWRGDVQSGPQVEVSAMGGFEGLLYRNKSSWVSLEQAREVFGAEFDPHDSDDWCLSADGARLSRADDYYVGSYGDFLENINQQIDAAANDKLKAKLVRQKLLAEQRVDRIDVSKISFNLFSPYVTVEEKAEFLRRFVHPSAVVSFDERTSEPRIEFDIPGSKLTDREKLIKRMAAYLKNGTITLGGVKLTMPDEAAIKELRGIINQANEQFNGWARSNLAITERLQARTSNPDQLRFAQVEDESPLPIPGMNPALTLHGYQNAYVRSRSRDFSGINGFDVGLGKTFTALAAVQYVQSIGVKKKTLFVVPNSVLSNWRREAGNAYANTDDCLFAGLREDSKGNYKVNSGNYDEDLLRVMENRHSKIFVTMEAFERIRLRDDTIAGYESFMRSVDRSFAENEDRKADERAKSKAKTILAILSEKTGSAPYLEDMGIDSIVIDEAHVFKNSAATVDFKGGKYLSLSDASKRGLDAQAKAWFVRGASERQDGVMMLTATPITNSPLEVYAMMSLAVGHERVNNLFAGTSGADGFMNAVCQIENEDDETIDGEIRSINVFKGLNNVDMIRGALHQVATIKNATDVGAQIKVPDAPEEASAVSLDSATVARLEQYKQAYRFAADEMNERSENRGDMAAYEAVSERLGEPMALIAHPFNLINKMTMLIADPDLDNRVSRYQLSDSAAAQAIADQWNAKKYTEERTRPGPNCTLDDAISSKPRKDADGEVVGYTYKMPVRAWVEGSALVVDTISPDLQDKLEAMMNKAKADFEVSIPPKLAAMLENFQREAANPRGVDDNGDRVVHAKQIIFCDLIAMHNKIRHLLSKRAGVPKSAIAVVTGQRNNSPDQIQAVQDGFNAPGEDNQYRVIIANEKAEVGINLQKGTQAIHHLTIGWTPDSLTQRNGRGVRQGNKTEQVTIYHYDASGTFDAAKRTLVNSKADWIGGLMDSNGGGSLEISSGFSREQMEALIDVVGDGDAVTRLQEAMAAKEAEQRATSTRAKQRINLDTIKRQNEFLTANSRPEDWIAERFGSLMTVMAQVQKIRTRLAKGKMSETARARAESILAEQEARQNGIERQIAEAAVIHPGSYSYQSGTTVRTSAEDAEPMAPSEIVARFLDTARRGENRPADLVESVKRGRLGYGGMVMEVNRESELVNEWQSEVDMATAMRDQAAERYRQQAASNGALPETVADAFVEGEGLMVGDKPVIAGCVIVTETSADAQEWALVTPQMEARAIVGGREERRRLEVMALSGEIIYPNGADYAGWMMQAARLEDELERGGKASTWLSEACPQVAEYRETEIMAAWPAHNYGLPSPYFPVAIQTSSSEDEAPVLHRIMGEQAAIIQRWEGSRFVMSSRIEPAELPETSRDQLVAEYAKAHGLRARPGDFTSMYRTNTLITDALKEHEASLAVALQHDTEEEIRAAVAALFRRAVLWLDAGDSWTELLSYEWRRAMAVAISAVNKANEPPKPEKKPDTVVFVGGDTFEWKDKIKDYGNQYGGYRYWDGKAKAWRIQYQAWQKLIEDYPRAAQALNLQDDD